ncbi:MAG TPA: hypothetical protein VM165_00505 [Planctomycetaceae bacterium]|nr:hypothetical protein [Planctomycetaceae bacterium]
MRQPAVIALRVIAVAVLCGVLASPADAQRDRERPRVAAEPTPMAEDASPDDFDVPPDTPATLDGGATLNPLLLRPVRDDTLGLEYHDRPAYYYALWLCQQIDSKILAQHAAVFRAARQAVDPKHASKPPEEFPVFADVFQHPQDYRGRPVSLQGRFRKLVEADAGSNDLGINKVYEGWLYTSDSQSHPAVVVFTKKPAGLPLGGNILEEVRLTGYFLKMYGYEAQDTPRKAPMFLAGEVEWLPAPAAVARAEIPLLAYVAMSCVALLGAWAVWRASQQPTSSLARYNVPGRNFDQFPPKEFLEPDGPSVEPHH